MYVGAGRDRSGGRTPFAMLSLDEYTSRDAASKFIAQERARLRERRMLEVAHQGLGNAAYVWRDPFEFIFVVLSGAKIMQLTVFGETMENRQALEAEMAKVVTRAVPYLAP